MWALSKAAPWQKASRGWMENLEEQPLPDKEPAEGAGQSGSGGCLGLAGDAPKVACDGCIKGEARRRNEAELEALVGLEAELEAELAHADAVASGMSSSDRWGELMALGTNGSLADDPGTSSDSPRVEEGAVEKDGVRAGDEMGIFDVVSTPMGDLVQRKRDVT